VIVRLFGSFNNGLLAAGLPTRDRRDGGGPRHSRESLDAAFLAFVGRHGRWPRQDEIRARNGLCGYKALKRVYGTTSISKIQRIIGGGAHSDE
jgi:hypothetical protein